MKRMIPSLMALAVLVTGTLFAPTTVFAQTTKTAKKMAHKVSSKKATHSASHTKTKAKSSKMKAGKKAHGS